MATAIVDGLQLGYEVIGDGAQPWVITPGGRFTKETPGVRELAETLAAHDKRVLIWDRPNTGESDVCFEGVTESDMQADALASLLAHLDMTPAVVFGGSGGARVSLLTAARHPEAALGVGMVWMSGGVIGRLVLGVHYCSGSISAAWRGGMAAVMALPEWEEVLERNPRNRQRFLDQDPKEFIATFERWMVAYCPCHDDELIAGLPDARAREVSVPTLVFRSGESDYHHTRETSERLAALLPSSRLVEPPWGDMEWAERQEARNSGHAGGLFVRWPLLAPQLLEWSSETIG